MKTTLWAALLISLPSWVLADSYYLYPTMGKSSSESTQAAFQDLLSSAINETQNEVTENKEGAQFLVRSKLIRLGNSYIVTVAKYTSQKKKVFGTKMKASNEEELDKVASRLARALTQNHPAQEEIQVGEVTEKEKHQVIERTKALDLTVFGLGPVWYGNMKDTGIALLIQYGRLWEVSPNAAIKLMGEMSTKLKSPWVGMGALTLGAQYYLSPASQSLFLSGDFGYGFVAENRDDLSGTSGFTLGAGLGYNFFRTSEKQMSVAFRWLSILDKNEVGYPAQYGLVLSLYY